MEAEQILKQAAQASASDIFIVAGLPVSYKVNNQIQRQTDQRLMPEDTEVIVRELYRFAKRSPEKCWKPAMMTFPFPWREFPGTVPVYTVKEALWRR